MMIQDQEGFLHQQAIGSQQPTQIGSKPMIHGLKAQAQTIQQVPQMLCGYARTASTLITHQNTNGVLNANCARNEQHQASSEDD